MQPSQIINYLNEEQKLFNEAMDNVAKGHKHEIGNANYHSGNIMKIHVWFMQNGYVEA